MTVEQTPVQTLDLRRTKCPLNFVKAKLALEKLAAGDVLEIWLDTGSESVLNIPQSLAQEGHTLLKHEATTDHREVLWVQKS